MCCTASVLGLVTSALSQTCCAIHGAITLQWLGHDWVIGFLASVDSYKTMSCMQSVANQIYST